MGSMSDAYRYLKILGPTVPSIFKSSVWHTLGWSPESSKWDMKTNLVMTTVRTVLSKSSTSVSRQQKASMRGPEAKGPVWAAPTTIPVNEDDVRQLLFSTIEEMRTGPDEAYTKPTLQPVTGEWTGYRSGVSANTPPPEGVSPADIYSSLVKDTTSSATILYFHGGAHYLMDPVSHRPIVQRVCEESGARAFSVRYRLAPAHPFPAGLLDCLVAYLGLICPAEGALHEAIEPESIVFAGDSAGGNLCFALLALLLHVQRKAEKSGATEIRFNGKSIALPLPLPGGMATNSPWMDMTRSSPSLVSNYRYDYIPLPSMGMTATPAAAAPTSSGGNEQASFTFEHKRVSTREHNPGENKNPFPCELWPETPPRADLYVEGSMMCHPLASPLILPAEFWRGSPPVFMEAGEEMLSDEIGITARRLHAAGVQVRWAGFEAMPHCFVMLFGAANCAGPAVAKGYEAWGSWITGLAGRGKKADGKAVKMEGGTWFAAPGLEESDVDLGALASHVSDAESIARMHEEMRRRCEAYDRLLAANGGSAKL